MNRKISLYFFLGVVLLVGFYFFRILQPFLFPLLMAGTLALLAQPMFLKVIPLFRGHRRLAATFVSVVVVLIVVLPAIVIVTFATQELIRLGDKFVNKEPATTNQALATEVETLRKTLRKVDFDRLSELVLQGQAIDQVHIDDSSEDVQRLIQQISQSSQQAIEKQLRLVTGAAPIESTSIPYVGRITKWLSHYIPEADLHDLQSSGLNMARALLGEIYDNTTNVISNLVRFVIGFAIMILAFYYFLAEGPAIADELESLLPFDTEDEVAVVKQFETVCRGVVLGTLSAAVAQAALVGAMMAVLRVPGTWLWTCLTVVVAMIPMVGAGGVYVPVSLYLFWYRGVGPAALLLLYGLIIVSTADNLIRAHMIHDTSRLHPLVALISAFGSTKARRIVGHFRRPCRRWHLLCVAKDFATEAAGLR